MSDSGLSFYPAEEASQYELRVREPSQLELSIRTCRLLSSQALTQLTLATDHARTTAQGSYELLQTEENLPARLAVVGGLASLGLVLGKGRGRMVWAAAGAGTGAAFCYPDSLQDIKQSLYNGDIPEPPSLNTDKLSQLAAKSGEYLESVITSVKLLRQDTKQNLTEDKPKLKHESTLVFVKSSELQPESDFKGDVGMGREEDRDLYSTRG